METTPGFYGNTRLRDTLTQMLRRDRAAHGILFSGSTGLGKKTIARRFAAEMLCTGAEKPCGSCKSCRMLRDGAHPDVREVEHSGKRGGFSVETVRKISMDLAIPPNEGAAKFYLFLDCDQMDSRSQNLLLKSIEEPPPYAYFLFTAQAPEVLLPTVRSRILSLFLEPVTEADCLAALAEHGFSPEESGEACGIFHGNIGMCLNFLENESIRGTARLTKSAIDSIIKRDEYAMLRIVSAIGKDREQASLFLTLLDRTIRDAMVWKHGAKLKSIGCDDKGAEQLSQRLSAAAGQAIHQAVHKTFAAMDANVNLPLALSAFCADCMDAGKYALPG